MTWEAPETSPYPVLTLQFTSDALNNTGAMAVATAAGWFFGGNLANPSSTDAAVVQFYDEVAGSVVIGSNLLWSVVVPPSESIPIDLARPIRFFTALSVAAVGGWLRAGAGAVNSNITAHLEYS